MEITMSTLRRRGQKRRSTEVKTTKREHKKASENEQKEGTRLHHQKGDWPFYGVRHGMRPSGTSRKNTNRSKAEAKEGDAYRAKTVAAHKKAKKKRIATAPKGKSTGGRSKK
jgi:hypothetical protein